MWSKAKSEIRKNGCRKSATTPVKINVFDKFRLQKNHVNRTALTLWNHGYFVVWNDEKLVLESRTINTHRERLIYTLM